MKQAQDHRVEQLRVILKPSAAVAAAMQKVVQDMQHTREREMSTIPSCKNRNFEQFMNQLQSGGDGNGDRS